MRGVTIVLVAAVALTAAAQAVAKKGAAASTASSTVALAAGSQQAATARCGKGKHVTGGGWSVSPPYSAGGTNFPVVGDDTGLRVNHLQSQPSDLVSWTAGAAAFTVPATTGTFTSFARCESKSVSRTLLGASGSSTLPPGQQATVGINCPKNTHVLAGGFNVSPAGNLADPVGFRPQVLESKRRDARSWELTVVNPNNSPSVATVAGNTLCEVNGKGMSISERSASAPIVDNSRTTATASCTGKTHTVGGGFLVSPSVGPAVGVDQMQPSGAKAWQVGLYEYPNFSLPPGSTLTAYSYCRKN